ncbi:MAG: hypothetical protein HY870_06470 [Chloroflexi bacterium]|nr:hypothetical protein [Chloroflexota bacterium]
MSLTLTDQQQAVVDHPLGPARVFAVVGAIATSPPNFCRAWWSTSAQRA